MEKGSRNSIQWRSLFIVIISAALVVSIGLTLITSRRPFNSRCSKVKMTSACAHNPASHLRLRPDRDVLPTNVVPMLYDLTIKPDMDNFTFEGKVSIE